MPARIITEEVALLTLHAQTAPVRMSSSLRIGLVTVLALACSGCFTVGTNNVTNDRLERGLIIFVEDSTDTGNRNWRRFEDGLSNRGVSLAVENFDWSPTLVGTVIEGGPVTRTDSGEAGINLARSIRHYGVAYPGRPIHVVGHGVGAHIALNALEELDPRFGVDRLVLLMPNIDTYRNLSAPLERVRDRAVVYHAGGDILHGGLGPTLLGGTHDTARSRAHASWRGLKVPEDADLEQYDKLHIFGWRPEMALRGNLATHNYGPTSPFFVRKYVLPFLLDGLLPDVDQDDLGVIPD